MARKSIPDWVFLATVFVTGASVLVIEIVGTRILAPFFGSGVYTWSALIATTLAALALGYKVGGQIADRYPLTEILYGICLTAGIWTALTFWLAGLILPSLVQLDDIRYGVLLSGFLLFFPNLFLLGSICPFCIRLLHRNSEQAGTTSGLVFSISTLGSLLGALVTGFLLIPGYGTQFIFIFCGLFLIVFSLLCFIFLQRYTTAILVLVFSISITYYPITHQHNDIPTVKIIKQTPSFYGQLQVIRKDSVKMMLVDGIGQNYVVDNGRYTTPYINFMSAIPAMHDLKNPYKRALVIGLGAGQLPMLLHTAGLDVDAVEIDPVVVDMAKNYFSMSLDDNKIYINDGRVFLTNTTNIYEYMIIDAFNSDQLAWHLISKEAIKLTKNRLSDDGILAINLTSIIDSKDVSSIQMTLESVYEHVSVFSYTPDNTNNLSSIVFLSSSSPIMLSTNNTNLRENQLADVKHFLNGKLDHFEGGLVLTDEFNPVSHQRKHVQLVWRQAMREYLGKEKLDWLIF